MDHPSCSNNSNQDDSNTEPSLLVLNNDCLIKIFENLDMLDYISLAKNCTRLQDVADSVPIPTFKGIEVEVNVDIEPSYSNEIVKKSKNDFVDKLTSIGVHFVSIKVLWGNEFVLETIKQNCMKLKSLEMRFSENVPKLQGLIDLKILKIEFCGQICINDFRECFANSPNIETLEYDHVDEDFMKLLELLPKLKSLALRWTRNSIKPEEFHNLLLLNDLTKLSFRSDGYCNNLLMELSTKLNLVELEVYADLTEDTFDIIKTFRNLEFLSLAHLGRHNIELQETIVLPPQLKYIRLVNISITLDATLAMAKHHTFLEEIDLSGAEELHTWFTPR